MNETYLIPVFVAGTLMLIIFAVFIISYLLVQKQKQNRNRIEVQQREYEYQSELLRTQLEVQELAINRISRELHDNINAMLATVRINVQVIAVNADDQKRKLTAEKTQGYLEKISNDVRHLSHTMNAGVIKKMGLVEALKTEVENVSVAETFQGIFSKQGDHRPLEADQELLIFRIAQEAIHNIIKHAKASVFHVLLKTDPKFLSLEIKDNGIGVGDASNMKRGIGFANMQQRSAMLGGMLTISSEPGPGTSVTLTINRFNEQ